VTALQQPRHPVPDHIPAELREASIGATILTGITTTGQEWAQYWGDLDPDGQPLDPWRWCTCCRDAREAYFAAQHAREAAAGLQLNLFGTEVAS
jgi:hypothetical protein